jgi:HEAT repeat protein
VAAQTVAADGRQASVDRHVQMLRSPEENVRLEGVTQLGRLQDQRALDPLAATLAGDASATVREAAARALALIGSPRALPALRQAAQNDRDHDVRHSAQFAMDVLQTKY